MSDDILRHIFEIKESIFSLQIGQYNLRKVFEDFKEQLTLKECMDKQIHKIEKDLKKGAKDTKALLKMDKKFDKKLEHSGIIKKKKKK